MALLRHYTTPYFSGNIYLWEITETLDELITLAQLDEDEKTTLKDFKSHNRQLEWCATRALLQTINKGAKIKYNSSGAPYINENCYISISHTNNCAVIALSPQRVGVDIERRNRNFNKIAHRYISEQELSVIEKSNIDINNAQAILWSFKESVFKFVERGEIDFKEDLQIKSLTDSKIEYIFDGKPFYGAYYLENDFVISFAF
ncbi:MAG: 4'-phosphopantetheinyl transferase superfamily protein [Rikenellaceae bacterium]